MRREMRENKSLAYETLFILMWSITLESSKVQKQNNMWSAVSFKMKSHYKTTPKTDFRKHFQKHLYRKYINTQEIKKVI